VKGPLIFPAGYCIIAGMTNLKRAINVFTDHNVRAGFEMPSGGPASQKTGGRVRVALLPEREDSKEQGLAALHALRGMFKDDVRPGDSFLDRKHAENALEYEVDERRAKEHEQCRP
jgi:hypothetical protein